MPQAPSVAVPKRLPLVIEPANRATDPKLDARLVNAFMESHKDESWIYKRPGLSVRNQHSGAGMGLYQWFGDIYAVAGGVLYKNGANIGTVDGTGGVYAFSQTLSTLGGPRYMVMDNTVKMYTYDGTTLLEVTNVNLPVSGNRVKGLGYLDATTYVLTPTAEIHGSTTALNNPNIWDPLSVMLVYVEPDQGVALNKQLVYIIALKQWSSEVFYDAGTSPGTPLARVQGAKINFGCVNADTVQEIDGMLIWACNNRAQSAQVILMDKLNAEIVSIKAVERLLGPAVWTAGEVFSWQFKDEGHSFYVLTVTNINLTLVYDLKEKMWCQWTDEYGNYMPIVASCSGTTHIVQHATNGAVYNMDSSYFTDAGAAIPVDIYTPNFDGGVEKKKHLSRLGFLADQTPGSVLQVRTNDYDYQANKWTNFRRVDLNTRNPALTDCGTFKQRAHHLRHVCNTSLRIKAVDLQIDLCTL